MKFLQYDDFIRGVLTKIEFSKTLFICDFEMGYEVFIPKDLS